MDLTERQRALGIVNDWIKHEERVLEHTQSGLNRLYKTRDRLSTPTLTVTRLEEAVDSIKGHFFAPWGNVTEVSCPTVAGSIQNNEEDLRSLSKWVNRHGFEIAAAAGCSFVKGRFGRAGKFVR